MIFSALYRFDGRVQISSFHLFITSDLDQEFPVGSAARLEERGLLCVLEPKSWLDDETTNQLANIIVELITTGAFDGLSKADYFAELSQSRMGYSADMELAKFLVEELQAKGLAKPSEDGVSIPLHPTVRNHYSHRPGTTVTKRRQEAGNANSSDN